MSYERTTSECPRCAAPVFLGADHGHIGTDAAHRICAAKHREEEAKPRSIGALAFMEAQSMLRRRFPDMEIVNGPALERTAAGRRATIASHEGTTPSKGSAA